MLSGCSVLFETTAEVADLLNCSYFSREINTSEEGNQWIQFDFEEAFYLHHELQAITIVTNKDHIVNGVVLWEYMMLLL